ncbi:MAG: fused MFS/spermidine synthase, partial [Candidatus Binatia bacterium]
MARKQKSPPPHRTGLSDPMVTRVHLVIFLLFGLSGVPALIYEIIWARELGLIFGTTVYAISTVLAIFFSGLALGSLLFGKIADAQNKPLPLYGFMELAIGVYGAFTPWIFRLVQRLQLTLGSALSLEEFSEWSLLRFVLSFSALIVPATLIGGTLPVMIKYFAQGMHRFGNVTAKLYSINTFGAVIGTILAGFFLVLWLGVNGSVYFAACLNLAIGAATLFIWHKGKAALQAEPEKKVSKNTAELEETQPAQGDMRLRLVLWGFFLSGFAALALEVLWTRALILTIGITTYAFSIILITFLLGISLGSLIAARFVDRMNVWNAFGILEILRGASVILLMPIFGTLPFWYLSIIKRFGWSFGAGISTSFTLTVMVLLLPTLLMGATFPVVAKIVTRDFDSLGVSVGRAYMFNTLGGVGGSLAAGFLLIPLVGVQNSIVLAAVIYLLVGSMITFYSPSITKKYKKAVIITAFVLLSVGMILPSWNKSFSQSSIFTKGLQYLHKTSRDLQLELERPELLFYKEGIASLVAVQDSANQLVLKINGKVQSGTKTDLEPQLLLGHLPMLFHPDPKQALVIGLGTGMTVGAFEQYKELEKVTVVELEPEVVEAAEYFAKHNNDALKDPRLELAIGDGRNYLLTTDRNFDIISSHPSNVWIKGMVNLLTKEYFELAKSRLAPDGIMALWMSIDGADSHGLRSILATFQDVFPHTTLWASTDSSRVIFLGSPTPLVVDFDLLKARMAQASVRKDLRRIGVINPEALFSFFVLDRKAVSKMSQSAALQTDNYPILEFSAPEALYSAINNIKKNKEILRKHYASPQSLFGEAEVGEDTRQAIKRYEGFRKKVLQATFYGQVERATFTLLREAFDLFPHNEVVQRTLIGVYDARINYLQTKRGREKELSQAYQDKIKVYRDILALDDKNSTLHRDLGWAYRMLGNLFAAELEIRKALALDESDSMTHQRLGSIYGMQNRYLPAEKELLRAVELNPKNY